MPEERQDLGQGDLFLAFASGDEATVRSEHGRSEPKPYQTIRDAEMLTGDLARNVGTIIRMKQPQLDSRLVAIPLQATRVTHEVLDRICQHRHKTISAID